VRPIAIGPCRDLSHEGHETVVSGHPVGPERRPRGLLTLWRCPVEGWGGFWHDLGRDPQVSIGGGPSLETLPGDDEDRRRLFRRD
jgi:hypothetical protein